MCSRILGLHILMFWIYVKICKKMKVVIVLKTNIYKNDGNLPFY